MKRVLLRLANHDLIILFTLLALTIIGLVNIFATTRNNTLNLSSTLIEQIVAFILGYTIYFILSVIDFELIKHFKLHLPLFLLMVGLLILALLTPSTDGTPTRWITLGGFTLQISEFTKIFIILNTATAYMAITKIKLQPVSTIWSGTTKLSSRKITKLILSPQVLNVVFVSTIIFLILIQPSLGNALLNFGLWILLIYLLLPSPLHAISYAIIFLVGVNIVVDLSNISLFGTSIKIGQLNLLTLILSLLIVSTLSYLLKLKNLIVLFFLLSSIFLTIFSGVVWNSLPQYQQDRVNAFLTPQNDPSGSDYQVDQSKLAIASAGLLGKGFLQGTQINSGLLPFAHTDFVYAAHVEQFGGIGAIVLLIIYTTLLLRTLTIASHQPNNFGKLICSGVAVLVILNIIVNVGMNLGLMPVTGVPLPLISSGGSSVVSILIGFGLVQMINSSRTKSDHQSVKLF